MRTESDPTVDPRTLTLHPAAYVGICTVVSAEMRRIQHTGEDKTISYARIELLRHDGSTLFWSVVKERVLIEAFPMFAWNDINLHSSLDAIVGRRVMVIAEPVSVFRSEREYLLVKKVESLWEDLA